MSIGLPYIQWLRIFLPKKIKLKYSQSFNSCYSRHFLNISFSLLTLSSLSYCSHSLFLTFSLIFTFHGEISITTSPCDRHLLISGIDDSYLVPHHYLSANLTLQTAILMANLFTFVNGKIST